MEKIKAVEMVRKIRDQMHKKTSNMTDKEQVSFYKKEEKKLHLQAKKQLQTA